MPFKNPGVFYTCDVINLHTQIQFEMTVGKLEKWKWLYTIHRKMQY